MKMDDFSGWLDLFLQTVTETFGERVWFVGLQGSRARAEATEASDIDTVVILEDLTVTDLETYGRMLDTLPNRELICGFLSGKREILNWDPADLFQFYHDTTPIKGSLEDLLPLLGDETVARAIKMGSCGIYHGCVHNMLHDKSEEILKGLYKSASFVVQAICFQQTGSYIRHQKDLLEIADPGERVIVETFLNLKNGGRVDFQQMSETLFAWAQSRVNLTK